VGGERESVNGEEVNRWEVKREGLPAHSSAGLPSQVFFIRANPISISGNRVLEEVNSEEGKR